MVVSYSHKKCNSEMELLRVSGYSLEKGFIHVTNPITDANRLPLDPFPGGIRVNRGRRGESSRKCVTSTVSVRGNGLRNGSMLSKVRISFHQQDGYERPARIEFAT